MRRPEVKTDADRQAHARLITFIALLPGSFMPAILAFLMIGVITCMHIGFDTGLPLHEGRAFVMVWPIAVTTALPPGLYRWNLSDCLCIHYG